MYINAKIISVETIPGIRGVGMEKSSGGGEFKYDMIYLIHCKNFCKCYNAPSPRTTIILKI
jgi:hypothetical protein